MHNMQLKSVCKICKKNMQKKYAKNALICRFWWYYPILHAICKICKITCTICKICKCHFQYAEYALPHFADVNLSVWVNQCSLSESPWLKLTFGKGCWYSTDSGRRAEELESTWFSHTTKKEKMLQQTTAHELDTKCERNCWKSIQTCIDLGEKAAQRSEHPQTWPILPCIESKWKPLADTRWIRTRIIYTVQESLRIP